MPPRIPREKTANSRRPQLSNVLGEAAESKGVRTLQGSVKLNILEVEFTND